jgi:hypothetical protein
MSGEVPGASPIFPGSQAAANLVRWIDRVLVNLREGRMNDARAALEAETWRTDLAESGIPRPILEQARESLDEAADALARPEGAADVAEAALLVARSRLMPGA